MFLRGDQETDIDIVQEQLLDVLCVLDFIFDPSHDADIVPK